jgi:ADP-heptose:LPS heptosyltransferase
MGDMLQTTPMIRSLRHQHPNAHITVLVRDMGKIIAERNADIDDVIVYNEDETYLHLRSNDSDRLLKAYEMAEAFIQRLKAGRFDIAYNCTHSLTSTMLLKLAGIPKVTGAQLNPHHQYVIEGKGPACFFASVLNRDLSELNLCDVFRHFAPESDAPRELVFDLTEEDRQTARTLLAENGIEDRDLLVCMQLGASDRDKRWPAESFGQLAQSLRSKHNAKVALLGVESEAPLAEAFEQTAPGIAAHLFGKSSVPVLAAILERSQILVSNDTGTMHIAAAVQCPVVLMSVGYVHFRETGPYAEHCVALERRRENLGSSDLMKSDPGERVGIDPSHAMSAVEFVLEGCSPGTWNNFTGNTDFEHVDVYASEFSQDGCLAWHSLEQRPYRRADLIRHIYRLTWIEYLRETSDDAAALSFLNRAQTGHSAINPDDLNTWTAELINEFDELAKLAAAGSCKAEELANGLAHQASMKWAKSMVTDLMHKDEAIRVYGEIHDACRPLVILAKFERENLQGTDPRLLAEATRAIYDRLNQRALLAASKTEFTGEQLLNENDSQPPTLHKAAG